MVISDKIKTKTKVQNTLKKLKDKAQSANSEPDKHAIDAALEKAEHEAYIGRDDITGTLFCTPLSGYGSSRDLRVIFSIMQGACSLSQLTLRAGMGRSTVFNVIQLIQEPFPVGYSMVIESTEQGYVIKDFGVINQQIAEKLGAKHIEYKKKLNKANQ